MNRSSSTSAYYNILYRGGLDVVLMMGELPLLLVPPEEGTTVALILLSPFLPVLLWVSFFLSSSRGNTSKSNATLAMTSKAPENEEEDLGDRFVSKNKEKELERNANTSIDPSIHWLKHSSIHRSINQLIHQLIHQYIDQSIGQSIDWSIHWSIDPSILRSFNRSTHWSIYPSINQLINALINTSINQCIDRSIHP